MKILIDADACPVIRITERIAKKRGIPLTLVCDNAHMFSSDYAQTVTVDRGADAADFKLFSLTQKGDIVITQDYGVAVMALGKGAFPIHQSGRRYTEENIDGLLMERHLAKCERRKNSRNHLKGPGKRTAADDLRFEESLCRLIDGLDSQSILETAGRGADEQ